ncbi:MAG: hypothetical protein HGB06_06300 [Chlorobaculum sp.]|jgi:uncharacterized protein YceK|nr:hypothetical protein [Chlorobaculum sp.]
MKIYALLMITLLGISGCTTTYKGSVKGASNQQESKSNKDIVGNSNQNQAKP